jgi:homoserine dehydrogenase
MNVKIALLGCGTVGSGVLELLTLQRESLEASMDLHFSIDSILVRDKARYKEAPFENLLTTDFDELLKGKPDLLIELIGGIEPARTYILKAIEQGCHIITANKDLLAEHGYEIFKKANEHHVSIGFEASVGGGIPIIKPLKDSLRNGGIHRIEGIVNGTCNYILTRMTESDKTYQEALSEAMASGFAESNPHSDVSGLDSARKLCILSTLAFSKRITPKLIYTKGIEQIDYENIQLAKSNGLKIKLVALAIHFDQKIYNAVRPCVIGPNHPFYSIDHEYNGIRLYGHSFGKIQLSGKGAGKMPTASAVFGDFLDYCHGKSDKVLSYSGDKDFSSLQINPEATRWILQITKTPSADELGRILQTFSDHKLSIHQNPVSNGIHLEIEDFLESDLIERLSLLREWCPQINVLPMLYLN